MTRTLPSVEQLRELLEYEPKTGVLRWLVGYGGRRVGSVAGCREKHGYVLVKIGGRHYKAHRVAWALYYGAWPVGNLDHLNGLKHDNRLANLRPATPALNGQNMYRARRDSRSGMLGAHRAGDRWQARIGAHGRQYYIGTFSTAAEAHAAYLGAKVFAHPESGLAQRAMQLALDLGEPR